MMKKALLSIPLISFSILSILSIGGRVRFGHGLGDMIYHLFIYLGVLLSLIHFVYFRKKGGNHAYVFTALLIAFFVLVILKMTLWRGSEYAWNGKVLTTLSATAEKRKGEAFKHQLDEYDERLATQAENCEL